MLEYGLRFLAVGSRCLRSRRSATVCAPRASPACSAPLPRSPSRRFLSPCRKKGAPFAAMEGRSMMVGGSRPPSTAGHRGCCSKNSSCPRGQRRPRLWLSGSRWSLVYPRLCFCHDCSDQAFHPSSDALVRVSRQIRARRGEDRGRRPHRGPLRASRGRPVSRLSGDLSRKRDIGRKACPRTQGKSGSCGGAARKPRRSMPPVRRSELSGSRLSACDLYHDRAVSGVGSRPRCGFVARCRSVRLAGAAMALEG